MVETAFGKAGRIWQENSSRAGPPLRTSPRPVQEREIHPRVDPQIRPRCRLGRRPLRAGNLLRREAELWGRQAAVDLHPPSATGPVLLLAGRQLRPDVPPPADVFSLQHASLRQRPQLVGAADDPLGAGLCPARQRLRGTGQSSAGSRAGGSLRQAPLGQTTQRLGAEDQSAAEGPQLAERHELLLGDYAGGVFQRHLVRQPSQAARIVPAVVEPRRGEFFGPGHPHVSGPQAARQLSGRSLEQPNERPASRCPREALGERKLAEDV